MGRSTVWLHLILMAAWPAGVGLNALWRHGIGSAVVPDAALAVALAASVVHGHRALPGLVAGAVLAVAMQVRLGGAWPAEAVHATVSLLIAIAASHLLRVRRASRLASPRSLALFLATSAAAAVLRGGVAAALPASGPSPLAQAMGTLLGMLLLAPAIMAWTGLPASDWRSRRLALGVAVPLLALATSAWAARYAERLHEGEAANFVHQARTSTMALQDRLQGALDALAAIDSVLTVAPHVAQREFERVTHAWADRHALHAMGVLQQLPRTEHAAYEAELRSAGAPTPWLRSATGDGGERKVSADEPVAAIRLIAPRERNAQVLGINSYANPLVAEAVDRALSQGQPASTRSFPLRLGDGATVPGLVVYQRASGTAPPRAQIAFVTMRFDQVLPGETVSGSRWLACVYAPYGDKRHVVAHNRPSACEPSSGPHRVFDAEIEFAGQRWKYEMRQPLVVPFADEGLVVECLALGALAVVALLLLTTTGHARLYERAAERARAAQAAAESLQRAKIEFMQRVRHELGVPLTALLGAVQLMRRSPSRNLGAVAPWIERITHASAHLRDMIDDLFVSTGPASDQVVVLDETVELAPLVAASVDLAQQAGANASVRWTVQPVPAEWRVRGDGRRIRQVLVNLLTNAAKYNRPGGEVRVLARAHVGHVVIEVQDDGIGLTPDQRDRLFRRFERLGRESSGIQGMGLGLYLSQQLARRMGGSIRVASKPGRGSTFALQLRRAPNLQGAGPQPRPGLRTLLAFEDDPIAVELLAAVVAQRRDWQLVHRDRLADGLSLVRTLHPDVVLLDHHLPDGDGHALLAALRADQKLRTIPVVLVSAYASVEGLSADAVAPKPWDLDELERTIDAAMRPRAQA